MGMWRWSSTKWRWVPKNAHSSQ